MLPVGKRIMVNLEESNAERLVGKNGRYVLREEKYLTVKCLWCILSPTALQNGICDMFPNTFQHHTFPLLQARSLLGSKSGLKIFFYSKTSSIGAAFCGRLSSPTNSLTSVSIVVQMALSGTSFSALSKGFSLNSPICSMV